MTICGYLAGCLMLVHYLLSCCRLISDGFVTQYRFVTFIRVVCRVMLGMGIEVCIFNEFGFYVWTHSMYKLCRLPKFDAFY